MNATQLLQATRALIPTPDKWIQGRDILDDGNGRPIAFCIYGAMEIASGSSSTHDACCYIKQAIHTEFIGDWNDAEGRTHAEVLAALDRAIELSRQES